MDRDREDDWNSITYNSFVYTITSYYKIIFKGFVIIGNLDVRFSVLIPYIPYLIDWQSWVKVVIK